MVAHDTAELLGELGFSQYEARAYIGLMGHEPQTGYALAVRTQIPQPKVYETLRRLEIKRAVVCTSTSPAKYVAVAPDRLVASLSDEYSRRIDEVRAGLEDLQGANTPVEWRALESLGTWPSISKRARSMIGRAERHVYLSVHSDQLGELVDVVEAADRSGVRCDVLCFGRSTLALEHGRFLQHSSTNGVVYRHHQARHVAVVVDSESALWALAEDGRQWGSLVGLDPLLAAVVKGYIRHDMYVQQIFADFGDDLVTRYGAGMEQLILPSEPAAVRDGKRGRARAKPAKPDEGRRAVASTRTTRADVVHARTRDSA